MNTDLPHILVVDDDDRLRELLRKFLSENDFLVETASDVADARARLTSLTFDLIVLDLMMPGESGLDFAEDLRQTSTVPILMLTAMGEGEDRIAGLERGADDYLTKPFEPRELLLRVHSILRRVPRRPETVEAALLSALAEQPGATLSREELTQRTGASGGGRAVDVQVTRLRRKIERDPRLPRYLQTVRGKGYVLRPD
jgi:two-component system phosphate regulon response regulator OmpR